MCARLYVMHSQGNFSDQITTKGQLLPIQWLIRVSLNHRNPPKLNEQIVTNRSMFHSSMVCSYLRSENVYCILTSREEPDFNQFCLNKDSRNDKAKRRYQVYERSCWSTVMPSISYQSTRSSKNTWRIHCACRQ